MSKKQQDNFEFAFKRDIPLGKHQVFPYFSLPSAFSRLDCLINLILEKRQTESGKIMEKFQERIPVIIEKSSTEQKLPELDQQK
jgi:hypothetical protein